MIVICGAKNKHNQLYGTNYALSIQLSIKGTFTQRHEEYYNRGIITKSPEMTLFEDLQKVMTVPIKSRNSKVNRMN